MSEKIEDGGPAFPTDELKYGGAFNEAAAKRHGGMSLRDYAAIKAMQTLITIWADGDSKHAASTCDQAYIWADAMLNARKP